MIVCQLHLELRRSGLDTSEQNHESYFLRFRVTSTVQLLVANDACKTNGRSRLKRDVSRNRTSCNLLRRRCPPCSRGWLRRHCFRTPYPKLAICAPFSMGFQHRLNKFKPRSARASVARQWRVSRGWRREADMKMERPPVASRPPLGRDLIHSLFLSLPSPSPT